MHEASIAQSLLGIVQRAVEKTEVRKIVQIEISIGRLKAIEPELLVSCFDFMAEETVCEGAELMINEIPISVSCEACGEISDVSGFRFRCGICDSGALKIIRGSELKVDRIQAI